MFPTGVGCRICSLPSGSAGDERGTAQLPQGYHDRLFRLPPHLFWLFIDSTTLVFSSFTSTLLGMSCSVSLLSRDEEFRGSSGPAVGHTRVTGRLPPRSLQQEAAAAEPNPKSSPHHVPMPDLGRAVRPQP